MELPHLHSLWVGPRLGYLERLCIASAKAAGHAFTLWSYDPANLDGVPADTQLRDAAEIMPAERLLRYRDSGSVALGANLWRTELLAKSLGCWVDMDLVFLRPLDFGSEYIFGWEYENWINNAVLMAPADSELLHDMLTIPQPNRRPPWWGPRKSAWYYWQRLTKGRMDIEDYPWGTFSAGMLTHVIKSRGLQEQAQGPEVFYPVRWKDAQDVYGPAEVVEERITPDTRTVHLWHSRLVDLCDAPPAPGSFIAKMCERFDVDTNA